MSATTPRYDITYPTGTDLVSQAPAQFKTFAESVESALGEVDDRQTENAVKPVVRTTLDQLADASAVDGQSGLVTDDDAANGLYYRRDGEWYPVEARAKRKWYGTFTRSDGQLQINNGTTAMTVTRQSGTSDITVKSITKGSRIGLPAGRWLVSCIIQFTGIQDQTWVGLSLALVDGAGEDLTCRTEKSTSGGAYDAIELVGCVESDGTQGFQINFSSNAAGTMRTAGQLRIIEL